jgi:hypothetical protein
MPNYTAVIFGNRIWINCSMRKARPRKVYRFLNNDIIAIYPLNWKNAKCPSPNKPKTI